MRVARERCAGVDVHKRFVEVHVITPELSETRQFGTMMEELWDLVAWLRSLQIEEVAMESTGVYWKPLYNLLEAAELQLGHFGQTVAQLRAVGVAVDRGHRRDRFEIDQDLALAHVTTVQDVVHAREDVEDFGP